MISGIHVGSMNIISHQMSALPKSTCQRNNNVRINRGYAALTKYITVRNAKKVPFVLFASTAMESLKVYNM